MYDNIEYKFFSFLSHESQYNQVRFLDNDGLEKVRADRSEGHVHLRRNNELQNKSKRYYYSDIVKLPYNGMYFSKFDLNVEKGELEIPIKPMIRVGTRVKGCNDEYCGLVIVNYLGQKLNR